MKAITQRESVVTYIKSCLLFQIPRLMLISKYHVISPLNLRDKVLNKSKNLSLLKVGLP